MATPEATEVMTRQRWRSELQPTTKCLCYARDLDDSMIAETRWQDGILWSFYRRCPVHPSNRHVSVAWMPGMSEENETAVVQTAVESGT